MCVFNQQKQVRVNFTLKPELLSEMKDYLKKLNQDKSLKPVSQSKFISIAIDKLLQEVKTNR